MLLLAALLFLSAYNASAYAPPGTLFVSTRRARASHREPTPAAEKQNHPPVISTNTALHQPLQRHRAPKTTPLYADFTADLEAAPDLPVTSATSEVSLVAPAATQVSSLKQRLLSLVGAGNAHASADGLTLRQRLTKMGVFAAMAYNVVSQVNSGSSMSIAWYLYSLRTGLSPLAPGQWKGYLAFYTGFWVVNNFLRPIRIAIALALAPKMERLTTHVQERLRLQKTKAVTITFVLSYVVALMYSITCFAMASLLSGVAIFPSS